MTESHRNRDVEWLTDGNFVDPNGDVRGSSDHPDGITFDDVEKYAPADAILIDNAISGIKHKDATERQNVAARDPLAIAQRALYLLDKDSSLVLVRTSVESHPSMHNVPIEKKARTVDNIIQAYYEKLAEYKKSDGITQLDQDVRAAIICNRKSLDDKDLERIAVSIGHDKDHFKPKVRSATEDDARERDYRERQFKD